MKTHVLIAGGAGYIGSHMVKHLHRRGYAVTTLDNLSVGHRDAVLYGDFIHADLPWTYGPLGWIFVSPAMHRWHHAREIRCAGTNFATVFSVFDQAFRTYHVPGACNVPLGVRDDIGQGALAQLAWPFRAMWRWAEGSLVQRTRLKRV